MPDLTAHNHAHRRLRARAKEVGCYVVCVPDVSVRSSISERRDRYELISNYTGKVRGVITAPHRQLTAEAVDRLFDEEVFEERFG